MIHSVLSSHPGRTILSVLLLYFALFLPLAESGHAELVDKVVAVVNDEVITLSELEAEAESLYHQIATTTPPESRDAAIVEAREEILNTLIDKRLITQKAKSQNITVTDGEVDAAFQQMLQRSRLSKAELLQKLSEAGVTEAVYRTTLASQILQNKLVSNDVRSKIIITEEMILDYYDTHYTSQVDEGSYYLLQIGFSWQDPENKDLSTPALYANKLDAQKRAQRVHGLARSGQDFGELARKFSDLPSAADGGDIGIFMADELADYMLAAVTNLQPNDISEIIETPAGYQFFKLLSGSEGAIVRKASYASVKDDIKRELYDRELQKAYGQWVRDLKSQAYIQKL